MLSGRVCQHAFSSKRAAAPSRTALRVQAATAVPAPYTAVKPVGDRVFVKVDKEESKTAGGVLLPTNAQKKPTAGEVVAQGETMTVKVGDRVVYSKYAGTELKLGAEEHVLLKEDDCIGIASQSGKIAQLKPMGDRVLIKVMKASSQTAGGVLLANENAEKPLFGEVVAVGDGRKKEDSDEWLKPNVKIGSTVMYSKYSGTEFDEDDEEYIVVRESDILASLS